jgi:hypothetical protein
MTGFTAPTLIAILDVSRRKAKSTATNKQDRIYYQVRSRYQNDITERWLSRWSVRQRFGKEALAFFENGGKENVEPDQGR